MAEAADPILASVLQRRVHAITQEMATVLMRSSRSPIFNEIGDLVTVVFDRRARTLAQTEYASIIAAFRPAGRTGLRTSSPAWSKLCSFRSPGRSYLRALVPTLP